MVFPRVKREPRLSDKVAELLLESIIARRFEPGERLPSERELGEQFGVSRTVIREAVRALSA
jgi:GntR family transcriptional repressor for pyruvate dehydrogenase complex